MGMNEIACVDCGKNVLQGYMIHEACHKRNLANIERLKEIIKSLVACIDNGDYYNDTVRQAALDAAKKEVNMTVRRFRLKAVEAVQYDGSPASVRRIGDFVNWACRAMDCDHPRVFVGAGRSTTLGVGDWVVRYGDGRYAVMTEREFSIYEEIIPPASGGDCNHKGHEEHEERKGR